MFELKNSGANHYCALKTENIVCVPHCHTSYELVFVTRGKIKASVDGISYNVSEGSGIVVMPMQIHSYSSLGDSSVNISIFSKDYIADFHTAAKSRIPLNPIFAFGLNDAELLQTCDNRYLIKSLLYKYCAALSEGGFGLSEKANGNLISKIVVYTQENFKNNITLRTVAKELGYSYNYLSAYFKPHFSCGFSEYINRLRLEECAYLLKSTDMPITDIAYSSGFTSVRRFNDVFKSEYRLTPTQYRKS